jgi:hypothetical protein
MTAPIPAPAPASTIPTVWDTLYQSPTATPISAPPPAHIAGIHQLRMTCSWLCAGAPGALTIAGGCLNAGTPGVIAVTKISAVGVGGGRARIADQGSSLPSRLDFDPCGRGNCVHPFLLRHIFPRRPSLRALCGDSGSTSNETEHCVLARPFARRITESSDTHAPRQPAFNSGLHEIGRQEGERYHHIDLT